MAKSIPIISIIIPHWNGIEILSECINSLQKTEFDSFEIIVCDNASTDGSQQWLKENHNHIVLIENQKNYGYAGGCNRGADIAKGEYLVFLNNDTIHDPNWLKSLFDRIKSEDTIAAVQPKILNYFNKDVFDYAGAAGGFMDILCYPFARGRLFFKNERDEGQYDSASSCFWASGTAIMVRRDLFIEAGKFDEIFFAHMEEIDLCWRLHAMGYEIWVEPMSKIFHKNGATLPMDSHLKFYLNHRNSLIMLFSNYSLFNAIYIGTLRIMLEFIAMGYAIFKLNFNHLTGILRSLAWIIFHPITIFRKRMRFKEVRKIKDRIIFTKLYRASIIISYYLKRKKTYSEIVSKAA